MENENPLPPYASQAPVHERSAAKWMHLGPLLALVGNFLVPIPFLSLIVAVVLYYTQRDKSAFVESHGKESINFQITLAIIFVVLVIVMSIVFGGSILSFLMGREGDNDAGAGIIGLVGSSIFIGFAFMGIALFALVVMIIASIRANDGKAYSYPINLRLIR